MKQIKIMLIKLIAFARVLFTTSLFTTVLFTAGVSAQPLDQADVPQPLQPWVDWVLQGKDSLGCPYRYDEQVQTCAWPSRLNLDLNDQGGKFTQQWQLFSESLIQLPGEEGSWPLNVRSGDTNLLVQSLNGEPHVLLPAGGHTIEGQFKWSKLPKSLYITPGSGLVDLAVNSRAVPRTQFDDKGQLWLMQSDTEKVSEDNIDMQVFRRVLDGHPIQVETYVKLRVSGKQRNTELGSVLLDDFIATSITSDLPARFEGDGKLILQLRPGEWSIRVVARAAGDRTEFTMPEAKEPWPQQEVWVFVSNNSMRQVQVGGVTSIDPNQTRLPNEWKGLPAYLLAPNQTLKLDVKERGITNLARNKLNLQREMWLDFDGKGYSIRDSLRGELQQSRINVLPQIDLGQVRINELPQFITQETGNKAAGVEVRQKQLNLSAESRYNGAQSSLPSNGWQLDMQKVDTQLHLPPGWRVLAVTGADNLPNTWVEKWSLLDLFLVMIIVLSIRHFYGWRWAGLALATVVLVWQEPGAPTMIWLNLLAVTALLKVLPENKYTGILTNYRWASLAVLAIILLTYVLDTVRISIYPQLDVGYTQQWMSAKDLEASYTQQAPQADLQRERLNAPSVSSLEEVVVTGSRLSRSGKQYESKRRGANLKAIDPNSMIQSGPGLPSWNGYRTISLSWAGPVKPDQVSRIMLISPRMNIFLRLLGVGLLLALAWCFLRNLGSGDDADVDKSSLSSWASIIKPATAAVLLCVMLPFSEPSQAQQLPSPELLNELQKRLTQPPKCLDACAQIERMMVTAETHNLQVRLRVHSLTNTSIPIPASQATWLPKQILLNGQPATGIARDTDQVIWLSLSEGHHDVVLNGALSQRISFPLPLPLNPKSASWSSPDGSWTIEGIDENGIAKSQLQLSRVVSAEDQQSFQTDHNTLATFVKVERQLQLGLDWYVQTTVSRVSPQGVPLNISIPLLANEQVLDEQLSLENGAVKLNFPANESSVSWSSRLTIAPKLKLKAAMSPDYLEVWSIDASSVWRVEAQGLPVNRLMNMTGQRNAQRVVPVWQPWPGEVLSLDIDRPAGVLGQTVTVQGSQMYVKAGKRVNDVNLNLTIRSSRGLPHPIQLPQGADVQELQIDGVKQRVQIDDSKLSVMLKPGSQDVAITWREPNTQSLRYRFPDVDLGLPSVNAHAYISLPQDRWVLWTRGPVLGPAVLFWSVLSALFVLALVLGWSKLTPLNTWQWFLLAIGLSQTSPLLILVVVACLVGLSLRERLTKPQTRFRFNLMQLSMVALIGASLMIIVGAVANGLLGNPDMQIAGNGSSSYLLRWYQDRATAVLPQPEVLSVPIWVYRVLMLAWAMWLAMSLLKWIKWGWSALSKDELWRSKPAAPVDTSEDAADAGSNSES